MVSFFLFPVKSEEAESEKGKMEDNTLVTPWANLLHFRHRPFGLYRRHVGPGDGGGGAGGAGEAEVTRSTMNVSMRFEKPKSPAAAPSVPSQ